MKTLAAWGESKFHAYLKKQFPHTGDDAAVVSFSKSKLIFTSDSLEEGLHFSWEWISPQQLAWKLLAVNLSDLAAMGAKPLWALLSLAIPKNVEVKTIQKFFQALKKNSQEYGVRLLGGDSDASDKWRLSLTLVGEASCPVYRHQAQVGDDLWISGEPGFAALGLEALQKKWDPKKFKKQIQKQLQPIPRMQEGQFLAKNKFAHAMMDVSDGLLLDLERLCQASKVGAEIALPRLKGVEAKYIAGGGEDYELLFSAAEENRMKIQQAFRKMKTPLHLLGKVKSKSFGIQVENMKLESLLSKGYRHFS